MYKPLVDRSTELFLPNMHLIAQNTITLLETNQRFIESYMVGLNHEFARELLWREYPTDQRGSYFRQFWDVSAFLSATERPTSSGGRSCATSRRCTCGRSSPSSATTTTASTGRERGGAGARHPRRAAQEVSQRRDLRPQARCRQPKTATIDPTAATRPRTASFDRGRPDQDAALRGQGQARRLLLRIRPRRGRGPWRRRPSTTIRVGSS